MVRLEGTNVELGKKIIAETGLNVIPADDLDDAAQKIVSGGARSEAVTTMSILVNKNTKVICQGFTGKTGTFHTEQALAYTAPRWSAASRPGKGGRPDAISDLPVFDTVAEAQGHDRRQRLGHLRAAALRRRRDPRGDRRRNPADRLHHRRHPGARHGQGQARARQARSRA